MNTDKPVFSIIFTGFFERLISLVGFMDAAMALVDEDQNKQQTINHWCQINMHIFHLVAFEFHHPPPSWLFACLGLYLHDCDKKDPHETKSLAAQVQPHIPEQDAENNGAQTVQELQSAYRLLW